MSKKMVLFAGIILSQTLWEGCAFAEVSSEVCKSPLDKEYFQNLRKKIATACEAD